LEIFLIFVYFINALLVLLKQQDLDPHYISQSMWRGTNYVQIAFTGRNKQTK
jgi:hypothetical protein